MTPAPVVSGSVERVEPKRAPSTPPRWIVAHQAIGTVRPWDCRFVADEERARAEANYIATHDGLDAFIIDTRPSLSPPAQAPQGGPSYHALAMDVLRCIPADWKSHYAREWGNLGPILAEFIDDLREGRYPERAPQGGAELEGTIKSLRSTARWLRDCHESSMKNPRGALRYGETEIAPSLDRLAEVLSSLAQKPEAREVPEEVREALAEIDRYIWTDKKTIGHADKAFAAWRVLRAFLGGDGS